MTTRDRDLHPRATSADAVLQPMTEGRFRHMPVIEDGKLIGLITIGDVVKARLTELSMEKDRARRHDHGPLIARLVRRRVDRLADCADHAILLRAPNQ